MRFIGFPHHTLTKRQLWQSFSPHSSVALLYPLSKLGDLDHEAIDHFHNKMIGHSSSILQAVNRFRESGRKCDLTGLMTVNSIPFVNGTADGTGLGDLARTSF